MKPIRTNLWPVNQIYVRPYTIKETPRFAILTSSSRMKVIAELPMNLVQPSMAATNTVIK